MKKKPKKAPRRTKPGCVSYLLRDVDADIWSAFQDATAAQGATARDALIEFVRIVGLRGST